MGRKQAKAIFAALIAWPALAQDYNPVPIPGQIIGSPETMTPLNGGDDSTRLIQLGFPFEYFGQTFSSVYVSTNGFVSFGDIGNLCCDGWPIENAPRNAIYGLWTDLISGGNPYFRTDSNQAVFGWYATQEFGSWQSNTFEIALFADGKVQLNYGDVNNLYHTVTAGLTGPTMADSISLFYGQNVNLLDNTSYVAGVPSSPEPEPEPLFNPVDVGPSVIPSPVSEQEQVEEQQAEQVVQEVIAEQEAAIAETPVVEEPIAEEPAAQEVVVEQETQEVVEVVEEAAVDAERLSPDELAALAADAQSEQAESDNQQADQLALEAVAAEQLSSEAQQGGQEAQQATQAASSDQDKADDAKQSQSQSQDKAANALEAAPEARRERLEGDLAVDPAKVSDAIVQAAIGGADAKADTNVQFFQLEAAEDADTFQRERVIPVSVADAATVAINNAERERLNGEQTTTETPAGTYDILIVDGPTFMPTPTTGMGDVTSPAGQAQQMELLGMNGMQTEMASGEPSDIGDINSGDKETMTQLAAVPVGYSGYTQLRLPDAPFYEPREIYRGRRIPDANMALYRMMSGQDAKWSEMVGEQYE